MTDLKTALQIRDDLADFLTQRLKEDSRISLDYDGEAVPYDLADNLIRAEWVTGEPE